MKKISTYIRSFLFLIGLLLTNVSSYASHVIGADLYYTWVSGDTYTITLVLYGDCSGASFPDFAISAPRICVFRGTSNVGTVTLNIQAPSAGVDITPVCPGMAGQTKCSSSSYSTPGIKKFVYSANYTLPAPTVSNCWQFAYFGYNTPGTNAGRTTAITNISNAGGTSMQLVDTLDNSVHPNNSSTQFTVIPTPFFCNNTSNTYNPGCVDPDGDVLDISLIPAKSGSGGSGCGFGGNVTYNAGLSGPNPLRVLAGSFTFNATSGQMNFTPNAIQRSTVVYNIREFRAGAFVGSCQREMNFLVQTCTNPPPTGGIDSGVGGVVVDSTTFTTCADTGPFSMQMNPRAANPANSITVNSSGVPAGATLNVTGNGTPTPTVDFSWTSMGTPIGTYVFYLTYTDNNCPLSGTTTIAVTIIITPSPTVSYTIVAPATCVAKSAINIIPSGTGSPWIITVKGATPHTVTGVTGPFIDSLSPGVDTIFIESSIVSACSSYIVVTTTTTTNPPDVSGNTPCTDSALMLTTTTVGSGISYNWTGPNGFTSTLQNPVIMGVSASSAGIYTLTITNEATGCVTSNTVSITVKPKPVVSATDNTTCEDETLSLSASSAGTGATYSWTGPGGFSSVAQNPTISPASPSHTGSYTVVATLDGCPSVPATGNYTVYPTPVPPTGKDTSYCQYEVTDTLEAYGDNLLWYTSDIGGTGTSIIPIPGDSLVGTQTWYVTQTINGCESPRTPVNITTLYLPVFDIAGITTVCLHDSTLLSYHGPTLVDPDYSWTIPAEATIAAGTDSGEAVTIRFDEAHTHFITLTTSNYNGRCVSKYTVPVDVVEPPLSYFHIKPDICIGDTVVLALTQTTISPSTIFSWDFDGADIVTRNSNSGGPYSLTWHDTGIHIIELVTTNDIGCITPPVYDTFNIHAYPDARINTPEAVLCLEDTIVLSAAVSRYDNSYTWAPAHFFSFASQPLSNNNSTVTGKIERSGYVTLSVTSPFGCTASDSVFFDPSPCCNVVFPNAFSPNGDNNNDVFRPIFSGFHRFHVFRIINRWGQTVFETTNNNQSWDGNFNGVPQDMGVYYYYLKYDCGANTLEEKGDVTLVR